MLAAGGGWFEREHASGRWGAVGEAGGCSTSCMHSAASAFVNAKASTDFRCTFSALVCFILDAKAYVFVQCRGLIIITFYHLFASIARARVICILRSLYYTSQRLITEVNERS